MKVTLLAGIAATLIMGSVSAQDSDTMRQKNSGRKADSTLTGNKNQSQTGQSGKNKSTTQSGQKSGKSSQSKSTQQKQRDTNRSSDSSNSVDQSGQNKSNSQSDSQQGRRSNSDSSLERSSNSQGTGSSTMDTINPGTSGSRTGTTGGTGSTGTGTTGTTGRTGTTGTTGTGNTGSTSSTGTGNTGTTGVGGNQGTGMQGDKIGNMTVTNFNSVNARGSQMVKAITPARGTMSQADQQLLMQVASGGQRQLALSQAVLEKLTNPQIKMLAASEVEEQTAIASKLREIASAMGITLPPNSDSDGQNMKAQIQNLTGNQLDSFYLNEGGIRGHEMLEQTMTTVNSNAKDASLKQLAAATLPVIRTHLSVSRDVRSSMGTGTGSTGTGSTGASSSQNQK